MALGTRARIRIDAMVEGVPLMNEIEDFSPPDVTMKRQTISGQFIDSDMVVGVEKLEWSLKINGSQLLVLQALGSGFTDTAHISVIDSGKTQDGIPYIVKHSLHGPITGIAEEPVRQGEKMVTTITGTANSYKKTDTGITLIDIDARTGKVDLGAGDIMGIFGLFSF